MTFEDVRFCLEHEYFETLLKYHTQIDSLSRQADLTISQFDLLIDYTDQATNYLQHNAGDNTLGNIIGLQAKLITLQQYLFYQKAIKYNQIEAAVLWISNVKQPLQNNLSDTSSEGASPTLSDTESIDNMLQYLVSFFHDPADSLVLACTISQSSEQEIIDSIDKLQSYNSIIENMAKSRIDDIGVIVNDSLAVKLILDFYETFPKSKWHQAAYYYHLYHLSGLNDYSGMRELFNRFGNVSLAHQYITTIFLASPSFRKSFSNDTLNIQLLEQAKLLINTTLCQDDQMSKLLLYDEYDTEQWHKKLQIQKIKISYFELVSSYGFFGDEDSLIGILPRMNRHLRELCNELNTITYCSNDRGELSELSYWKARLYSLSRKPRDINRAAKAFVQSLIYGSPRKRYDSDSLTYLQSLYNRTEAILTLEQWIRSLVDYSGPTFRDITADTPLNGKRYTRIAVGDYDNDGWHDLLFNGNNLYRNHHGTLIDVSDTTGVSQLDSNGALWADFNKDGLLDFVSQSNSELFGEQLMKNQYNKYFVSVNERAGDILNTYPTEGAAWIDSDNDGYPELYFANYEKWQHRTGFEDQYLFNDKGYFFDLSDSLGFYRPYYCTDPGLAGRGVAPADYDNDGVQEIYVTNYRLGRNFCWNKSDDGFSDTAPSSSIQGYRKQGYYGHSIGADWGDYDNDGDLDLFVANLAHPRYIDISDISILYRNDGPAYRVVECDTLSYWSFTNVTNEAGISFDELHSDPLWIDIDNDGFLDLFITSVYENDRSYLYHNLGNGKFVDITYLSGTRLYNGWGNSIADINRDGLADIICGSGNGTKIFINTTQNTNGSLWIKPVWTDNGIDYRDKYWLHHELSNSPAFGSRFRVNLQDPNGHQYFIIRELSGAKGTSSQNAQELHFGIGRSTILSIERVNYGND